MHLLTNLRSPVNSIPHSSIQVVEVQFSSLEIVFPFLALRPSYKPIPSRGTEREQNIAQVISTNKRKSKSSMSKLVIRVSLYVFVIYQNE